MHLLFPLPKKSISSRPSLHLPLLHRQWSAKQTILQEPLVYRYQLLDHLPLAQGYQLSIVGCPVWSILLNMSMPNEESDELGIVISHGKVTPSRLGTGGM
eukprot:TRINITY_DN3824_c0_g2_i1.p3 TRINITY_DN3824_c0_g2~~TRINITY_DN3824_c0_g2_i1.p3  ORF type:complete len:100 (-),score=16.04 TRINITY_DN3824_c0_g2_i1:824-1123(-)